MPKMLNLGCGDDIRRGFINVDKHIPIQWPVRYEGEALKPLVIQHDLRNPWPWANSSIDFVLARDIIEHLPDKIATMNELWRVLNPGRCVHIEVPTTDGPAAWQDPQHVSYWNRHSFWYFEYGNVYRRRFADSYGIEAAFSVVEERIVQTPDGPKLTIILKAVK